MKVFEALRGWFERRRTLREMHAIQGEESEAFKGFFRDQIVLAMEAYLRGNHAQAYEIWQQMHVQ